MTHLLGRRRRGEAHPAEDEEGLRPRGGRSERGELSQEEVLKHHVQRMLQDEKARRFTTEFFGQWFGIYRLNRYQGIDATRFPEFDEPLRAAMLQEAEESLDYIARNNRHRGERVEYRHEQVCDVVNEYQEEERLTGYDVTYVYGGKTYNTVMPHDPGRSLRVRVRVSPAE